MSAFLSGMNTALALGNSQRQLRSQIHGEQEKAYNDREAYFLNSFTNKETGEFFSASEIAQNPELSERAKEFFNDPYVNRSIFNGRPYLGIVPTSNGRYTMAVLGDDGKPAPVTATGATAAENPNDPILEGTAEQMERYWKRIMDKAFHKVESTDRLLSAVEGERQRSLESLGDFQSNRQEMAQYLTGGQEGATASAAPDFRPQVTELGQASTKGQAQQPNAQKTTVDSVFDDLLKKEGAEGDTTGAAETGKLGVTAAARKAVGGKGKPDEVVAREYLQRLESKLPDSLKNAPESVRRAVLDSAYNLGESVFRFPKLREAADRGDWQGVAQQLLDTASIGGKASRGLASRRAQTYNEIALEQGFPQIANVEQAEDGTLRYLDETGTALFEYKAKNGRHETSGIGQLAIPGVEQSRRADLANPPTAQKIYGNVNLLPKRGTAEGSGFTEEQLANPSEGWLKRLGEAVDRTSGKLGESRSSRNGAPEITAEAPKTEQEATQQVAAVTNSTPTQVDQQLEKQVDEADPEVMQGVYQANVARIEASGRQPTEAQTEASIMAIYKQPTSRNFIRALSIASASGLISPKDAITLMDSGRDYVAKAKTAQANYDALIARQAASASTIERNNIQAQAAINRELRAQRTESRNEEAAVRTRRDYRIKAEEGFNKTLTDAFTNILPQAMVDAGVFAQGNDRSARAAERILGGMTASELPKSLLTTVRQNQSLMRAYYGLDMDAIRERGYLTAEDETRLAYFARSATKLWASSRRDSKTSLSNASVFPTPTSTMYTDGKKTVSLEELMAGLAADGMQFKDLFEADAYLRSQGIRLAD